MRYLLKVFSGPHVGAEVVLPHGESTIGSSDACDVVLDDKLIASQHVAVNISDDTIECRSLENQSVLVDGKPVDQAVIRPYQYFTIGTTHLAVGPADSPWPTLDFSDFQLREPLEEGPGAESDEPVEEETSEFTNSAESEPQDIEKKSKWLSTTAVVVLLIVGVNLVVLSSVMASWGTTTDSVDAVDIKQELKQVTKPYSPHVLVEGDRHRFRLVGFVPTEKDRETLLRLARNVAPNVAFKVRSTESLLDSVRGLLKKHGWEAVLTADAMEPGVIRIAGTLPTYDPGSRKRWKATESLIEEDVPLKKLVVELNAFPRIVQLNPVTPMALSSESGPPTATAARKNEAAYHRTPVPPLTEQKPTAVHVDAVPILDVRIAHDKVVTLPDGRQLSIGGRLPNGMWIESLDLDHAVARTFNGQRLIVPFGIGG